MDIAAMSFDVASARHAALRNKNEDASQRTLFVSTRASAQETKSALSRFTCKPRSSPPHSPRDVLSQCKAAIQRSDEDQSKEGHVTTTTMASTSAWSLLETPTLQNSHHDLSSSHDPTQSSTGDNVSLADSSITTEVTFPTTPSSSTPRSQSLSWQPRALKDLVRRDLTSSYPTKVERALQQVTLDCWDDARARSLYARAGAVFSIIRILEDWQDSRVLIAACQALEKLSLDADNELAVAELGGLPLLWNLAVASSCERVQSAAWAALQNCTCQLNEEWQPDMTTWSQLLPRIPSCAIAQACAAAANVCVANESYTESFAQAGGVVALAIALQNNWPNKAARADIAHSLARVCELVADEDDKPS